MTVNSNVNYKVNHENKFEEGRFVFFFFWVGGGGKLNDLCVSRYLSRERDEFYETWTEELELTRSLDIILKKEFL